jgi:hypothetical protein
MPDYTLDPARRLCRLREPPPRPPRGRKSRLADDDVRRMRYDYWSGRKTQPRLAADWGLTQQEVSLIVNFKRLAWV